MIKYIKDILLRQDNYSEEESTKNAKRFEQSISILKKEGVPYIDWLPVYDSLGLRSKEEICNRAISLMIVAVRAEGLELDRTLQIAKQYEAVDYFSPEEKEFLEQEIYTYEVRAKFSWRYESYWTLLWMLGYIDTLERPENICDVSKAVHIIHDRTKKQFIQQAHLRDMEEILDLADLTLRYHWAVRNEAINGKQPSTNLDSSVLYERRCAFSWVLNKESSWDEADTST